jgi:hypothetical protein
MRLQQPSVLVAGVDTAYLTLVFSPHGSRQVTREAQGVCVFRPPAQSLRIALARPSARHAGSPRRRRRGRDAASAPRAGTAGRCKPGSSPSAPARHAHRTRGLPRHLATLARSHDSRARRSRLRLQSSGAAARATDRSASRSRTRDRRLARDGSDHLARCAGAVSLAQGPSHARSRRSRTRIAPLTRRRAFSSPSHIMRLSHHASAHVTCGHSRRFSSLAPGRGRRGSSRSRSARPRSRSPMPTRRSCRSCART